MPSPVAEQNVFETILARRSVRGYTPQQVDKDTLRTLLEAAVRAPTAMHKEPWAFLIIQNKQVLQQLSDRAKPLFIEILNGMGSARIFSMTRMPASFITQERSLLSAALPMKVYLMLIAGWQLKI